MESTHRLAPWWRNPYLVLLAISLGAIVFFECAPLFNEYILFFHQVILTKAINNCNVTVSCIGAVIAYLVLLPKRECELWFILVTGLWLESQLCLSRFLNFTAIDQILRLGGGFLPGLVIAMSWRWANHYFRREYLEARRTAEVLGISLAMPVLYLCGSSVCGGNTIVYDAMLMAADSMFGTQISLWVSRALSSNAVLKAICLVFYNYLAFFMQLAQIITYKRSHDESECQPQPNVVPAFLFIVIACIGISSYIYFPAVGTEVYCGTDIYLSGPIPQVTKIPQAIEAPLEFPRNAMPSLHLAWILAAFFAVCRLKKTYLYVGGAIAIAVWLTAFNIGNHWCSDFIAACPLVALSLGITSFGASKRWRLIAILLCGPLYAFFLYLLKNQIVWVLNHQIMYLALVACIVSCAWMCCHKLIRNA